MRKLTVAVALAIFGASFGARASDTQWVLLVVPKEPKSGMLSQMFKNRTACENAKAWVLEQKSGFTQVQSNAPMERVYYAAATCIADSADAKPAAAGGTKK
ncbi:hypothetical protein [Paracidovorax citrulli]|uniref:hypothetical protein n=1 Tax=Paracidovorax citrulli TaxID=80869 RepID=UPI003FA7123F